MIGTDDCQSRLVIIFLTNRVKLAMDDNLRRHYLERDIDIIDCDNGDVLHPLKVGRGISNLHFVKIISAITCTLSTVKYQLKRTVD